MDPPATCRRIIGRTGLETVANDCRRVAGDTQALTGVAIEESAQESAQADELGVRLGNAGEDLAGPSEGGTHKTPPARSRATSPGLHTARSYTDGEVRHSSSPADRQVPARRGNLSSYADPSRPSPAQLFSSVRYNEKSANWTGARLDGGGGKTTLLRSIRWCAHLRA